MGMRPLCRRSRKVFTRVACFANRGKTPIRYFRVSCELRAYLREEEGGLRRGAGACALL